MASLAHSPCNNTCYQVIHVAQLMEPIASCLACSMHAWSNFSTFIMPLSLLSREKMADRMESGDDVSYGEAVDSCRIWSMHIYVYKENKTSKCPPAHKNKTELVHATLRATK